MHSQLPGEVPHDLHHGLHDRLRGEVRDDVHQEVPHHIQTNGKLFPIAVMVRRRNLRFQSKFTFSGPIIQGVNDIKTFSHTLFIYGADNQFYFHFNQSHCTIACTMTWYSKVSI